MGRDRYAARSSHLSSPSRLAIIPATVAGGAPIVPFPASQRTKTQESSMSNFIGQAAPAFTAPAVMPDGSTQDVSLSDYAGKYVALFFYPKDFTFV